MTPRELSRTSRPPSTVRSSQRPLRCCLFFQSTALARMLNGRLRIRTVSCIVPFQSPPLPSSSPFPFPFPLPFFSAFPAAVMADVDTRFAEEMRDIGLAAIKVRQ